MFDLCVDIIHYFYYFCDIMSTRKLKRRRTDLENQLRDGIGCPPKLSESVESIDGHLHFYVPSTNHQSVQHKVTIENNTHGLKYICTCKNTLEIFGICKHIRATLIHMMNDLMRYQEDTDKSLELIQALNNFNLDDCMSYSSTKKVVHVTSSEAHFDDLMNRDDSDDIQ